MNKAASYFIWRFLLVRVVRDEVDFAKVEQKVMGLYVSIILT